MVRAIERVSSGGTRCLFYCFAKGRPRGRDIRFTVSGGNFSFRPMGNNGGVVRRGLNGGYYHSPFVFEGRDNKCCVVTASVGYHRN